MTTLTATPMMLTATIPNRVTSFGDVSHVSLVSRCSDVRVIARFYVLWVVFRGRLKGVIGFYNDEFCDALRCRLMAESI